MKGQETFPVAEGLPNLGRSESAENGRKVLRTRRRIRNYDELAPKPAEVIDEKLLSPLKGDRLFDAQELSPADFANEVVPLGAYAEQLLSPIEDEELGLIGAESDAISNEGPTFEAEIATPELKQTVYNATPYSTVKQTRRRRSFLRFSKNSEGFNLEAGHEDAVDEERRMHHHATEPIDRRRYFTDHYEDATLANRPEGGHYFARNNGRGVLRDEPYSTLQEPPRRGVLREPFTDVTPKQPERHSVLRESSANRPEGGHYFARNNGRGVLRDEPYSTLQEPPRRGVLREPFTDVTPKQPERHSVLRESSLDQTPPQEQQPRRRSVLREQSINAAPPQPERRSVLRSERTRSNSESYDLRYDPNARPDIDDYNDVGIF